MTDLHSASLDGGSRSERLDRAIHALLAQTPEIEAAAVVSFDGLPMASALPPSMDEDRVAAMSAALLSLGERAAQGLGRGELSQVYIEGDAGTVFLISADDEAVLVAVASQGAKVGMMLYEVRRTAAAVAEVLREDEPVAVPTQPEPVAEPVASVPPAAAPVAEPLYAVPSEPVQPEPLYAEPAYSTYAAPAAPPADTGWASYAPHGSTGIGSVMPVMPSSTWS
jgi:predicted regulator of Ras-like GTPase activity (Roadblock/LC7/MglB family)